MPMYDYACQHCGDTLTKLRPLAEYDAPTNCENCGQLMQRIISAPQLNLMRSDVRKAHQINERSAHEPKVRQKHVCHSGCNHSHGSTADKPALKQPANQKRPWMLGH